MGVTIEGAFAGWDLHPLESAAFSRRTQIGVVPRRQAVDQIHPRRAVAAAFKKRRALLTTRLRWP
jgi:hypothetical protein